MVDCLEREDIQVLGSILLYSIAISKIIYGRLSRMRGYPGLG